MKRSILYTLVFLVVLQPISAKSVFRTAELERLAGVLALDVSVLPEGYCHPIVNGTSLTVHQTGQTIDHIGLYLFSEEIREQGKSPVFDFLERYFLQLKYPPHLRSTTNMTRDDQFKFLSGSLATVSGLLPTDDFGFSYDNRCYQATWSRGGVTLLSVSFPVEYELISGENMIEANDNLPADIRNTKVIIPLGKPSAKNDNYLTENITNRTYLSKGQLISSIHHPAESAANMMLSLQTTGDYQVRITQVSYGFKKTVFDIPLKQWIAFCQDHGCELYFGIENVTEAGDVDCVVIAVNTSENYNHVLTAHIASDIIDQKYGCIDAHLYPYVPTHNVRNMFAAFKKSNPKTFVNK